jgi:transcriptional regulator with XRE-family HTH domain
MDLVRLGLGLRALRRRRGWRQRDLATAARVGQTLVSTIERGHVDRVSIPALQAVAGTLDARLVIEIRWRAGDLDRLLDSDHARLSAALVGLLQSVGWKCRVEVTYATPRTRGSIDVLAWHAPTQTLLVIEIKTAIPSAEATLRKLDEKVALAANMARQRFGWLAAHVAEMLVIEDSSTNRRRLGAHAALFEAALPMRGAALRRWLESPVGAVAGRMFLSPSGVSAVVQRRGGHHRVRKPSLRPIRAIPNVGQPVAEQEDDPERPFPTILVGYERRDG